MRTDLVVHAEDDVHVCVLPSRSIFVLVIPVVLGVIEVRVDLLVSREDAVLVWHVRGGRNDWWGGGQSSGGGGLMRGGGR